MNACPCGISILYPQLPSKFFNNNQEKQYPFPFTNKMKHLLCHQHDLFNYASHKNDLILFCTEVYHYKFTIKTFIVLIFQLVMSEI